MEWDIHRLYESFYEHLRDHVGFPPSNQQNKESYFSARPPQKVFPFHTVPIPKVETDKETVSVSIYVQTAKLKINGNMLKILI